VQLHAGRHCFSSCGAPTQGKRPQDACRFHPTRSRTIWCHQCGVPVWFLKLGLPPTCLTVLPPSPETVFATAPPQRGWCEFISSPALCARKLKHGLSHLRWTATSTECRLLTRSTGGIGRSPPGLLPGCGPSPFRLPGCRSRLRPEPSLSPPHAMHHARADHEHQTPLLCSRPERWCKLKRATPALT